MTSRFELEEFCMNFLCGRESYLMGIVEDYIREFSEIKLEFTSETLDPSFRFICRYVFAHKPVNSGCIIAVLGFADKIHREYSHISWYQINMLVLPLVDVFEEINLDLDRFRYSYSRSRICTIL